MSTIRDPAYITNAGRTMMTAGGEVTYTKAVLYGQDISGLSDSQIKALTSLGNPLREVKIGVSDKQSSDSGSTVILEAVFQNSDLKADLEYKAVGFFARKNDVEQLVIVAVANQGAYLAATNPDGVATDALDLKIAVKIGDATSVTAVIDPAGSVTPATLNGAINKATHDLTAKIDTKADKTDVTAQFATKADKTTVESDLATKADQSSLDETNAEVAKKADSEDVTKQLATKANASDVADNVKTLQANIDTKADKATVDAEIAKIDFTPYAKSADVAKDLQGYTTTADLTKLLAGKRDIADSYSRDELDKKFLQLSTDTSGKVSADQIAKLLASKVDKTDLTSQLQAITDSIGTKANSANVTAELAKKDDTADVDAKIKTVTDLANTKANSSDVYTKSAVDTAFSQRDSRITNVTNLANQIDSTRLPLYQGSANEDLKGFFTPQIRMYNNATGVKNIPADCQYQSNFYGTLVVLPDGASNTNDGSQILITPERKAWISQSNGQGAKSWSDWSRFTLDSDLIALQNSLQSKIDTKANASDVYKKSEVDGKTSGIIITGYDIASETPTQETNDYTKRWLVDQGVLTQFADQINQLKGRRTVNQPDFNALTDGGSYYITNPQGGKNGPTGFWGNLFVSNGNGHRISQLYFPDDGSAPFMRELDESTWHNWIQLSTKQDVNNATNLANAASNKVDTVLANSYVRKQGMNANGDCVEIKHTGIKQANGGYAFDMWSDDWTASKLQYVIKNQLPSKADKSQINVSGNLFNRMTDDSTWKAITGVDNTDNAILTSIRDDSPSGGNTTGGNGSAIAFGGSDTKAVLSVNWLQHEAKITSGNGSGPKWVEDVAWKSDISNLQSIINQQNQTIQSLTTRLTNAENEIRYIKANYVEGRRFPASQEAQANSWENENPQRIAFITK